MPNLNKVMFIGHLVRDPETRETGNGNTLSKFTLAINRPNFMTKNGGQEVDFINCATFGKVAELVDKYVHKGDPLFVEGRLQINKVETEEGNRYFTDVNVDNIQFLKGKSDSGGGKTESKEAKEEETTKDEVPF